MSTEVVFKIVDSWNPSTIPMERLGQYLVELSVLYGEQQSVHFKGLKKGSTLIVSRIEEPAVPKVAERLARARRLDAPAPLRKAYNAIDRMLAVDNAKATLRWAKPELVRPEAELIIFPGRDRERPIDIGNVRRAGFVDGELVRIGGKDASVHLMLQDGDTVHSNIVVTRDQARQLGPLIFGPTLRLWGEGSWARGEDGVWTVQSFRVQRFETLEEPDDITSRIEELRSIGGSEWHRDDDPVATLIAARYDETGNGR